MFYFDSTYLFCVALPSMILMGIASWYVRRAYNKWLQVRTSTGITGADAARRLMNSTALQGVRLQGTPGEMSDHYDPRDKTVYLSVNVANQPSVASVAIAAHEMGHAMQDAEGYAPLKFRAALVPAVNIGSNLGWILIAVGLVIQWTTLAWVGVAFFALGAVFALATLPVEFDASARAKVLLAQTGIIRTEEEQRGVNQVLNAAALTYVAGLITAVLQLLYYVMLLSGRSRD